MRLLKVDSRSDEVPGIDGRVTTVHVAVIDSDDPLKYIYDKYVSSNSLGEKFSQHIFKESVLTMFSEAIDAQFDDNIPQLTFVDKQGVMKCGVIPDELNKLSRG